MERGRGEGWARETQNENSTGALVSGENLARYLGGAAIFVRLALGQILLLCLPLLSLFSLFSRRERALRARREETPGFLGKAARRFRTRGYTYASRVVHGAWACRTAAGGDGGGTFKGRRRSPPGIPTTTKTTIVIHAPEKSRPMRRRVRFRQLDDREDGVTARENRPENFPPPAREDSHG